MDGNHNLVPSLKCEVCGFEAHTITQLEAHDQYRHSTTHNLCDAMLDVIRHDHSVLSLYDAILRLEKWYTVMFCDTDLRLHGSQS